MRTILLIATGGTIASRPTAAGGLAPAITSQELLSCVPELAEFCRIDTIQLYNLDSTNMGPEQWQGIAAAVQENYDRYDGFVITHGTDTMGYTAAALSYMIQKSPKPVVLTGSQKSIYNRDTDARNNLWRAVAYACHPDAWGVQIVFDNQVILGTRARKTRTKSFNAFSSIDYPETAMFRDRRLIQFLQRPAEYTHAVFSTALDPDGAMFAAVRDWCGAGHLAVFTTQVPHEGSDLAVYEVGRAAKALPGVLEAHDMTPEATAVKLMWVLGQTTDRAEAEKLFLTPVQWDIL